MKKPKIALIYDFDKTLCTTDMQNYSFIPSLKIKTDDFWETCNQLTQKEHMDPQLSYMYRMIEEAKKRNLPINREAFVEMGKDIKYFPGVETWFERINEFGDEIGVDIQHYIISSGTKEIIEGSTIYKHFKAVFACEFLYVNDDAVWPKSVVNYTLKTQFLFRINKGVLDIADNKKINDSIPDDEKIVKFKNMIYIADGITDVPCMKLVREKGGHSIAVYRQGNKAIASQLFKDERVDFATFADYQEGSKLDNIVKLIIERISINEKLADIHDKQEKNIVD